MNMMQQLEMRALEQTTEITRRNLGRPTYIPGNQNQPSNITSTDVTYGCVWCNRAVAMQEDSHSTAPADKQIDEDTSNRPVITNNRNIHKKVQLIILGTLQPYISQKGYL